jgi:hypothetical protein
MLASYQLPSEEGLQSSQSCVDDDRPKRQPFNPKLVFLSGVCLFVTGSLLSFHVWMKINQNLSPNVNIARDLALLLVPVIMIWAGMAVLICHLLPT